MKKALFGLIVLSILLCRAPYATADLSIGIGLPNVSIGINLPLFPDLVPVPGYPVYYAPQVNANYFFYDGMYWVFQDGNWYASSWYNGPWALVQPDVVPLFILRVPVRYYRQPPVYFRDWRADAPPRWGRHWGRDWEQRHRGWSRWNRGSVPAPAPLPIYQRQYTGERYPRRVEQQQMLRNQQYRYQPRNSAVREHFRQQAAPQPSGPAQRGRQEEQRMNAPRQPDYQRSTPHRQAVPDQPPQQQRGPAVREERQQPGGGQYRQQEQQPQRREQRLQERGESRGETNRGRDEGGHQRGEERGRERGN